MTKQAKASITCIIAVMLVNGCLVETVYGSPAFYGRCLLEVNKKKYINGPCTIKMDNVYGNGGFTMETKPLAYFANITVTGEGVVGEAHWNKYKGAMFANLSLGDVVRKDACWQNRNAKVCAWKYRLKGNGEDRVHPRGLPIKL